MKLPAINNESFSTSPPFRGKVMETKRKLNIMIIGTDSRLELGRTQIRHDMTAPVKKPKIR
jgi:hypothetical protein